jgi:hypothetical protein
MKAEKSLLPQEPKPNKTQNKRIHKEQIQPPETTANPEPEKKQESK